MPRKSRQQRMLELLADFGIVIAILALFVAVGGLISVSVKKPILTLDDIWQNAQYVKVHVYHVVNGTEIVDTYLLTDVGAYANGTLSIASPVTNTTRIVLELSWISWQWLADRGLNHVTIVVEPPVPIAFGPLTGNGSIDTSVNIVEFSAYAVTHSGPVRLEAQTDHLDITEFTLTGVGEEPLLAVLTQPLWALAGMILGAITAVAAGIRRVTGWVFGAVAGAFGAFLAALTENPIAATMGLVVILGVFYMVAREKPRR